jgi:hypothetical protein
VTRARAVSNGNVLTVVDGEPESSAEIRREVIEPLVGLGLFEYMDAPTAPATVAPEPRKRGRRKR